MGRMLNSTAGHIHAAGLLVRSYAPGHGQGIRPLLRGAWGLRPGGQRALMTKPNSEAIGITTKYGENPADHQPVPALGVPLRRPHGGFTNRRAVDADRARHVSGPEQVLASEEGLPQLSTHMWTRDGPTGAASHHSQPRESSSGSKRYSQSCRSHGRPPPVCSAYRSHPARANRGACSGSWELTAANQSGTSSTGRLSCSKSAVLPSRTAGEIADRRRRAYSAASPWTSMTKRRRRGARHRHRGDPGPAGVRRPSCRLYASFEEDHLCGSAFS